MGDGPLPVVPVFVGHPLHGTVVPKGLRGRVAIVHQPPPLVDWNALAMSERPPAAVELEPRVLYAKMVLRSSGTEYTVYTRDGEETSMEEVLNALVLAAVAKL